MGDPNMTQTEPADRGNPDHFLVGGDLKERLPDHGPRYKETPPDPYAPSAPFVAEPFNAVTASFFIFIALAWGWRVWRAGVAKHLFVASSLPILLVGGIGGTLYHAFRTRTIYFLLDVFPISLLGLAGSIYLLIRVGRHAGAMRLLLCGGGAVAFYLLWNIALFQAIPPQVIQDLPTLRVNLSYASLAIILLIPLGFVLVRTRFRHASLIAAALLSFGIAWFCRLVDGTGLVDLPMGTHWLWHSFGAVTTALVIEYFFRLEREEV
jgi:hypothetical protein